MQRHLSAAIFPHLARKKYLSNSLYDYFLYGTKRRTNLVAPNSFYLVPYKLLAHKIDTYACAVCSITSLKLINRFKSFVRPFQFVHGHILHKQYKYEYEFIDLLFCVHD